LSLTGLHEEQTPGEHQSQQGIEVAVLAGLISGLADAVSRVEELLRELDHRPSSEWLRPEQMAARLGYLKADGTPNGEAFHRAAQKLGMPCHRIDFRTVLYKWSEVDEFLERLPG
jgi:hypothetical protein